MWHGVVDIHGVQIDLVELMHAPEVKADLHRRFKRHALTSLSRRYRCPEELSRL